MVTTLPKPEIQKSIEEWTIPVIRKTAAQVLREETRGQCVGAFDNGTKVYAMGSLDDNTGHSSNFYNSDEMIPRLKDNYPEVKWSIKLIVKIFDLNDSGWTFSEIADWLEAH